MLTGDSWNHSVVLSSQSWREHIQIYVGSMTTQKLVVKYETLLTNLHDELRKIMEFLEFPYAEDDLQCTVNSAIESFHRKHHKVIDPYTLQQRKFVLAQIKLANKIIHPYNVSY